MQPGTRITVAVTAATGLLFLAAAVLSLRPESRIRRLYGVAPDDDEAVRSNAVVVGATGVAVTLLGVAVSVEIPERVVGAGAVLVCAGACVGLGWLVRYRDRRELLTTPEVGRETAERLGAAAIASGVSVLPLAPAIWFEASETLIVGLALGATVVAFTAIAFAYR